MKQTLQANIGSRAFTLDEDAYNALREYFADIRKRLPEAEADETMTDLEMRMGEILSERVGSLTYVVSIDLVQAAINRLGSPDCFGESHETQRSASTTESQPRKLYRSREDRSIAGVCSGIAAYFHADVSLVRLITLLLLLFGGVSIWAYVILWIVLPEEPKRQFTPFGRPERPIASR